MLRKLLGTGLLLATLAGCTKLEGRTCSSDGDCGTEGLCDTSVGLCYAAGTEPELDGGTCSPACAAYEACTTGGCRPRFTALNILTPASNALVDGGTVQVSAQLVANPTYVNTTQYPDTLNFSAELPVGGDIGTFGAASRSGDTYTAAWTPPVTEAQFTLRVAHPVPDAGLSDSVSVTVDAVPPSLVVTIPAFDGGVSGGGTAYEDPNPGSFTNLWRRDQEVPIEVRTNEANLEPSTLRLSVKGTDGVSTAPVAISSSGFTGECDAGFCGVARVKLWEPTFNLFRGAMPIEVQGADKAGNAAIVAASSAVSVNVTRWKWAFDGAAAIKASPAVGDKGTVYFGTAVAPGKVFAIGPDGKKKWEAGVDAVEGSPAVGAFNGTTEIVYVASNFAGVVGIGSGTQLRALNGNTGSLLNNNTCTFSVTAGTPPTTISAAAVMQTTVGGTPVETGLFALAGNGTAVGMRPTSATSSTLGCVSSDSSQSMPDATANSGLVATNTGHFVYPTETRRVVKYVFGNPTPLWTITPGGGSGQRVFGMALLGNDLLGSGGSDFDQGGVFQVAFDATGTPTSNALTGTENGRAYHLAASGDGQLYYGREFAGPSTQLAKYNLPGAGVATSTPGVGAMGAAPVQGSDGKLYTINRAGELAVWSASDLASLWKLPAVGTNVEASPTLDCARTADGTAVGANLPGVLYVAAGNKLHAFVVDSPRMPKDSNSWPKFQHDARNTGNPATPVTNCP